MWEVMTACVIMHNMIVRDEHDNNIYDQRWEFQGELVALVLGPPADFQDYLQMQHEIRDRTCHNRLQKDLVLRMWEHVGSHS
jgi:hypothetical protein